MGVSGTVAIVQVVVALHRPECVFVGVFAIVAVGMNMARAIGMDMFVGMIVSMFMGFAVDRGFAFAAAASGAHLESS
jgi:hypothetical protein